MNRTFFDTPKLGFGLMRLPRLDSGEIDVDQSAQMVDLFLEAGMTYFDTAYVYDEGKNEEVAKTILVDRYPRERYTLATKLNIRACKPGEDPRQQLTTSLERTGAGYFDYYLLHAVSSGSVENYTRHGLWEFMEQQKAAGTIRHWGFSYHDGPELLDRLLTEHPEAEFVQLQLNYADWDSPTVASRANYEVARKHNKPVAVMEPVKGGTLAPPPGPVEQLFRTAGGGSSASWAIRYAASLDGIFTVLSGMSSLAQMEDNLSYMKDFRPLDEKEQALIRQAQEIIRQIPSIPCTGCRYCVAGCPQHIPIPEIFSARNFQLVWERAQRGQARYDDAVSRGGKASDCIACGQCEAACPQQLHIIDLLRQCADNFERNPFS